MIWNIFGCHNWGIAHYHVVSRGHRNCWTLYTTQGKEWYDSDVSSAKVEKSHVDQPLHHLFRTPWKLFHLVLLSLIRLCSWNASQGGGPLHSSWRAHLAPWQPGRQKPPGERMLSARSRKQRAFRSIVITGPKRAEASEGVRGLVTLGRSAPLPC